MSDTIQSVTMPKWGMTMTEGTLVAWLVEEGQEISVGDEVAEVDTEKLLGTVEAHVAGTLRRRVAQEGELIPVGGLLAVLAPTDVLEHEIDAFIGRAAEQAQTGESDGPRSETSQGPTGPVRALAVGNGSEAIVLVHGFGGDALNWRFNMEALAGGRGALAVDLPGHGESTKDVGSGTLDNLVAAAAGAAVTSRNGMSLHLVGHSLGALVATEFALRMPEDTRSLTLIAPAGLGEKINREFVDGIATAASRRELKAALQLLFAQPALVTRELVEEMLRYKREAGVAEALSAIRDNLFPDGTQARSIAADLARLDVPILVVWGAEDRVLVPEQSATLPDGVRLEMLDNVGHSPHVEAAARVNELIAGHVS